MVVQYQSKKLTLFKGEFNTEAVLSSHGGYTPGTLLSKGSGTVRVPIGMRLWFYANPDQFGIGGKGRIREALTEYHAGEALDEEGISAPTKA
jgi:hypothetical protein